MALIDWAWLYRPRIAIGSVSLDLPLPIMQTDERYSQDMKQVKVPLQNGVILSGVSRGPLQVTFNGTISKNTLSGVLNMKDAMLDLLNKASGSPFTLYRYYDAVRGNYRWYADCQCNTISFSPVNNRVYTMDYSFQITVPSGVEKALITTAGEAASNVSGNISGIIKGGVVQGDHSVGAVVNVDTLPDDRTLLYGPLLIKLPDTDGTSSFMIMDGDGNIIFKVDSLGRVRSVKPIALVRSISVSA